MSLCRYGCIGIVSGVINLLSKIIRGNVTYKVDIYKTFDTMSRKILLLVLTQFDFHPSFVGWVSTYNHSFIYVFY